MIIYSMYSDIIRLGLWRNFEKQMCILFSVIFNLLFLSFVWSFHTANVKIKENNIRGISLDISRKNKNDELNVEIQG